MFVGVMLTHKSLVVVIGAGLLHLSLSHPPLELMTSDTGMSYLPSAHVFNNVLTYLLYSGGRSAVKIWLRLKINQQIHINPLLKTISFVLHRIEIADNFLHTSYFINFHLNKEVFGSLKNFREEITSIVSINRKAIPDSLHCFMEPFLIPPT